MGFGGPQANVSTGGVRGRGSALPVLGNRCFAELTVPLHLLSGFSQFPLKLTCDNLENVRFPRQGVKGYSGLTPRTALSSRRCAFVPDESALQINLAPFRIEAEVV